MACSTGDACGLTDTRSSARSSLNQSAVIRLTIDALDAWWPPTFTPERFSRTRLAWWTIALDSHSTRRSMALSVSRSGAAGGGDGCVVVGEPLKGCDLPMPDRAERGGGHRARHAARSATRVPGAIGHDPVAEGLGARDLELGRFPDRPPLLDVRADVLAAAPRGLLGPVAPGQHHRVLGEELEHALHVARVPSSGELVDDVGVPHGEKARTVHPSSKLVPGRARRSSAPARLVRGARAVSLKAASSRI